MSTNPDVAELERYNLEAKRKTCNHSASVTKYTKTQVGYGRHCPDCDTHLRGMDLMKWGLYHLWDDGEVSK